MTASHNGSQFTYPDENPPFKSKESNEASHKSTNSAARIFLKLKAFSFPHLSTALPPSPLSSSVSTDNSIISAKWPVQALCRGWIYWEQSENQNLSPGLRWPPNTHALFLFHTHSIYRTCCMYLLSANILEFIQTHTYEYWWMLDCCLLLGWPFHPTVKHFF